MKTTAKNISGAKFNMLTAIEPTEKRLGSNVIWLCRCDCGVECEVDTGSLKTGNTRTCGCGKIQRGKANMDKINAEKGLKIGEAAFNQLYGNYSRSLKRRRSSLEFKLSKDEFRLLTESKCFYCGCEPNNIFHNPALNGSYIYNGIDRVDSLVGYYKDNCVSCCWECNRMKGTLSSSEFLLHINRISLYSKKD